MADLQHEGIVQILEERLDDGGDHFFVTEHLAGGTLRQAVLEKRLAPERVVPLLGEVAAALHFAHQRGFVHRGVRPAAILLDAAGRPKLTNFDAAQGFDTAERTFSPVEMLETFLYTAPEAMRKPLETGGVAADVYALAMTSAFCLSGAELPVEAMRDLDRFLQTLSCADGVRAVLRKAAAWEPTERFSSAADFARALEEGLKPQAEKEFVAEPKRKKGSRQWLVGTSLATRLETEIPQLPENERAAAVLDVVEAPLPIPPGDLESVGIAAWALDYYPARSHVKAEREEARELREKVLAPLRQRVAPPKFVAGAWAAIPGGGFLMGSPAGVGEDDEQPAHEVTISPLWLAVRPVTSREYLQFVRSGWEATELPANRVTWYGAYAYAAWLGGRLPTEAEWEYAARGRSHYDYSTRDGAPTTLDRVGWYKSNSGLSLHPVAKLEPNLWGLYDMYGNCWEWVGDWFEIYGEESQADPWGPLYGSRRVLRGGCYAHDALHARAASRRFAPPGSVDSWYGFRVALTFDPNKPPVG